MTNYVELIARVRDAEGSGPMHNEQHLPYRDCCGRELALCACDKPGKLTIGFGRNLEDCGISGDEAVSLLEADLRIAEASLRRMYPWVIVLDPVRYATLVEFLFNLGGARAAGFVDFWAAVRKGDWIRAGLELGDSLWSKQVGRRYVRMRLQIESGEWTSF